MKKLSIILLLQLVCVSAILLFACFRGFAEELTLTTYYPAPYGVYREMRSQKMAIGGTYYDATQHCWSGGPCFPADIPDEVDLIVEGNVGIGTVSPGAKLEVDGNVIADDPTEDNHLATKAYVDAQIGGGAYIVTTRGADSGSTSGGSYPDPFCPAGWTVETSWTYSTRASQDGASDYNDWTQTLCRE